MPRWWLCLGEVIQEYLAWNSVMSLCFSMQVNTMGYRTHLWGPQKTSVVFGMWTEPTAAIYLLSHVSNHLIPSYAPVQAEMGWWSLSTLVMVGFFLMKHWKHRKAWCDSFTLCSSLSHCFFPLFLPPRCCFLELGVCESFPSTFQHACTWVHVCPYTVTIEHWSYSLKFVGALHVVRHPYSLFLWRTPHVIIAPLVKHNILEFHYAHFLEFSIMMLCR